MSMKNRFIKKTQKLSGIFLSDSICRTFIFSKADTGCFQANCQTA